MSLVLMGSSSGSVTLQEPAVAGSTVLDLPATSGTVGLTTSQINFKNRIINGNMQIDQRNNGASVTPSNGAYTLDRWGAWQTASRFSVQKNAASVTPPANFIAYLGVTSLGAASLAAGDYNFIWQPIEGVNVYDLNWGTANARTVTLSFWVRSSLTGTFGGALINSAANRSYPFSYTISASNTWEQKSITIAGDTTGTWLTDTSVGVGIRFGLGSGANFVGTANTWSAGNFVQPTGSVSVVGTNGATWYITGVQFELGSAATTFDFRSIGTELALCQRYYQRTATTNNSISVRAYIGGSGVYHAPICFATTMRATPTLTVAFINTANTSGLIPYYQGTTGFSFRSTSSANSEFEYSAGYIAQIEL